VASEVIPENHGKGNETDHEQINNLGTYPIAGPMISPKNANQSIHTHTILHTPANKKRTAA
jgi:hypothetical protein